MVVTCCEALKSFKNHKKWVEDTRIRCPKLPELKNLKKPHLLTPCVNLYLQTPLRLSKAIFFVWNLFISSFWPKTISFQLVKHF